jgi:hypothetical protein
VADPRLLLTVATVVVVTLLSILGARLRVTGHDPWQHGIAAFLLVVTVWVPRPWRDVGVIVIVTLLCFGLFELGGWSLIVAAGASLVAYHLPGGFNAWFLALLALLFLVIEVKDGFGHLARLRRMERLVPDAPVRPREREVEATGVAHGRVGERLRGLPEDEPVAAYWVHVKTDLVATSEAVVRVETPRGVALLAPREARPEIDRHLILANPAATELAQQLGIADKLDKQLPALRVSWLRDGGDVCVIGVPAWASEPSLGSYRGGSALPRFGEGARVIDRSIEQIKKDVAFGSAAWLAWSALVGAVAVVQMLG